ncbi:hypothetical protein M407DRAFT_19585 [Tulasnella calospora MUT 4182]|uniref:Uncharacterized protein n=1 Tax=Tulasnella calospora MUT 4182 TaxID=1051891 RepID=A0A0C3QHR4_9AGAM|nr:hypothetical protein M407DRAFT_19585 [Tulasnella calospora MUT 4182]
MADLPFPPSTTDLNETVLHIQSISTILSHALAHTGESTKAHRDSRLRILDDLALLFVPGSSDGEDVVAVTAIVQNKCVTVETIHELAENGRGDRNPDPTGFAKPQKSPIASSKILFSTAWREEHARNMQYLLRDLYTDADGVLGPKDTTHLRFYVYCYCIAKVHSRFTAKILGFKGPYPDFILPDNRGEVGRSAKDNFGRGEAITKILAPSKVERKDKTWLVKCLTNLEDIPKSDWQLSEDIPAVVKLTRLCDSGLPPSQHSLMFGDKSYACCRLG